MSLFKEVLFKNYLDCDRKSFKIIWFDLWVSPLIQQDLYEFNLVIGQVLLSGFYLFQLEILNYRFDMHQI